jgi:uncharacterized protein (TIGR03084 family)
MLQEASDLRAEGDELHALLGTLDEVTWWQPTPFKGWTPFDVIVHLHFADRLAQLAVSDPDEFQRQLLARRVGRPPPPAQQRELLDTREPKVLLGQWRDCLHRLCDLLAPIEPETRIGWVGPSMGARTFATARLMEVWAHGQDVYDLLRRPRVHRDRIRAIAELGVRTFSFTFANRGLAPPGVKPHVRLTGPSGAVWEWNRADDSNRITGRAVEFCQVVTQGRNILDTKLEVVGNAASQWMSIAQCFAGAPSDPPRPGERVW